MRQLPPGLLALGLLVLAVAACNFSVGNSGEIHVDELYAAKDAQGKAGDKTTSFSPSDKTVYAVAELTGAKAGTQVKLVWYAAEVAGRCRGVVGGDGANLQQLRQVGSLSEIQLSK